MIALPRPHPMLLGMVSRNRGSLLLGAGLLVLWALGETLVPVVIGATIDHAIDGTHVGALLVWIALLALTFAGLSYGYRFGARITVRVMNEETHQIRNAVAAHAISPTGAQTDLLPGEIAALASSDADVAGSFLRVVLGGVAAGIAVIVGTGYLLVVDWIVGLVVVATVMVSLLVVNKVMPRITTATEEQNAAIGAAAGQAADLIEGIRVLKGVGGEGAAVADYRDRSRVATSASTAVARKQALVEATQVAISGVAVAVVTGLAGWRTLEGQLSVGELIAVLGVAAYLGEPMGQAASIASDVARSTGAARRIAGFLATGPAIRGGKLRAVGGELEILVPLTPQPVRIAPGEFVALVMPDAGAAAALTRAFAGGADAASVRIGGIGRHELDPEYVPTLLTAAPHRIDLFAGSLAENIAAPGGTPDPRILDAAAVTEILEVLGAGIDYQIEEQGRNLSGGQRQRIALARALSQDTPLLLLHDPTTAIDAVTEAQIAAAIRLLNRERTMVVVSTSPAILAAADRVLVIDGDTVRMGTHHELAARDAGYRELVQR